MPASTVAALALLAVVVLVAAVVVVRARTELRWYRQDHPYGEADVVAARADSLARSQSVVRGKVKEHLAPLLPEFAAEFEGRDARFLGSPVDFVVFDGLDEGEVRRVVFVEVKTGTSGLSRRERLVRDAVEDGRVEWRVLRLDGDSAVPARELG